MAAAEMKRCCAALIAILLVGCASTAEREAEEEKKARLIETQVQLASNYLQRGQLEVAKEILDKAVLNHPHDSQINNVMALLQWRLKDYESAERYFERAVRYDQKNADAQNNFGAFLCERHRAEDAEKWFRLAASNPLYKTPAAANENAGLCYVKKQALTKAESYFREALRIEPSRPMSLYQMAQITFDTNRILAARGFMQRYFQASEDTPEVLLLAVKIERALKNKDEEASYALRLRSKFPTSPEAQQLQKPTTGGKG